MKKIIKLILPIFILLIGLSCSEFSVKTEINQSQPISKIKSIGLIFRIFNQSRITQENYLKNITYWKSNSKALKDLIILKDYSNAIGYFSSDEDKFFQLSTKNNFLKFKSIGVIKHYLSENESELKKIISENNLEGLIIYEIYSIISTVMQFMDFDSIIIIVDKDLNILYMDHQTDNYESDQYIFEKTRDQLIDKISNRLITKLNSLNFFVK